MAGKRDEAAVTTRGIALRCCYGFGIGAVIVLALNMPTMVKDIMGMPEQLVAMIAPAALAGFAAVGVPLLVLTARPYWWGKLFVLLPAFSWAGFAGAMTVIIGWSPLLFVPLGCAGVMLAIAIAHQIIDPRFGGSPLN